MNEGNNAPVDDTRLARLLAFVERDPGNPLLLADTLALALQQRSAAAATAIAGKAAALPQWPAPLAAQLCLHYLRAGDPQRALQAGQQARASGAATPANDINTAWAAFLCGEYANAAECIHAAHPHAADCPPDINLLCARALHQLGKTAQARARLATTPAGRSAEDRLLADYLGARALITLDDGDAAAALNDASAALAIDAQQRDGLLAAAEAHKEGGDFTAAHAVCERLLALHPGAGRGWAVLAQVQLARLALAEAERCAREATALLPAHVGSWHLLGWACLLRGDSNGARSAFAAALPLERGFADTHGALAAVEFLAGNTTAGERLLKRAQRLDADSAGVQFARFLQLQATAGNEAARQFLDASLARPAPAAGAPLRELVAARAHALLAGGRTPP
jgi:Tfp pilus assembly protein PilF